MNDGHSEPIYAIIPAAGSGTRTQLKTPKQYIPLINGLTLLEQVLAKLLSIKRICQCVVAIGKQDRHWQQLTLSQHPQVVSVVGGSCRAESVLNALHWLVGNNKGSSWALVHDACRPCVNTADIERLIDECQRSESAAGAILAVPVNETVKQTKQGLIELTLERSKLWLAQTPQMFPTKLLQLALEQQPSLLSIGDEATAMELSGHTVALVNGSRNNIKITDPDDITMANRFLSQPTLFRTGSGFDVHAFTRGDHLLLGGVQIPCDKSIEAHSDGDILLHALCDALLGACALGDIGKHFPDNSNRWQGANSRELLGQVMEKISGCNYQVSNIDLTIVLQSPKVAPYIAMMIDNLSEDMHITPDQISIKATSTEKLGFVGREEGMAVQAQVLLVAL